MAIPAVSSQAFFGELTPEVLAESISKSLEKTQKEYLETQTQSNTAFLEKIDEKINKATANLLTMHNIQSVLKHCFEVSINHEVVLLNFQNLNDEMTSLLQTVRDVKGQISLGINPRQNAPCWEIQAVQLMATATARQQTILDNISTLSSTLLNLEKTSAALKKTFLTELPAVESLAKLETLTPLNFKEQIEKIKNHSSFEEKSGYLASVNLTSYLVQADAAANQFKIFSHQLDVENIAFGIAFERIKEQLEFIQKNNSVSALNVWKRTIEEQWLDLASKRLKLSLDRHLITVYSRILPLLRPLRNRALNNFKSAYGTRKEFESEANDPSQSSGFCLRSRAVNPDLLNGLSNYSGMYALGFVGVNQTLEDFYNTCEVYFAKTKPVEVYSSQPPFSTTPIDPQIDESETAYFIDPLKAEEIIRDIKSSAKQEKIAIWETVYNEIHVLKKIMLIYSAQVNCLVDAANKRGVFQNVRVYDLTRTAYVNHALCIHRPASPTSLKKNTSQPRDLGISDSEPFSSSLGVSDQTSDSMGVNDVSPEDHSDGEGIILKD